MFRAIFMALSVLVTTSLPGVAQELPLPKGDVILTISGSLTNTNVDSTAQLDLELLEALGRTTVETSTIWTEGTQSFEGVALADLVRELDLSGSTLRATAINDYAIEIPMGDALEGGPIIAYRLNGETMSVRDKGPLWIVYPYDSDANYRTEVVYSRSIWQLDRIEALE